MRPRPLLTSAVLGALLAAGCGTTVPQSSLTRSEQGLPSSGLSSAPADPGGTEQALRAVDTVPQAQSARPASSENLTGTGDVASGVPGRGVTDAKTVQIGIPFADNAQLNAAANSIANGLQQGDTKSIYNALINDTNKRGGVRGARLQPVWYQINLGSSVPVEEQAACTDFTQDHHVLAAVGDSTPNFSSCMLKGGSTVIDSSWSSLNEAEYAHFPYLYQPSALALDRLMRTYAPALKDMGYLDPGLKLGVLYYQDPPEYAAAESILETSLASLGVKVAMKEGFAAMQSESDIGPTQSHVQEAVLKFRAAGIDHVIAVENSAWLLGFFGVYAGSQSYYPRYAYYSNEGPVAEEANVSARSLQRAVFLGYFPPADVTDHKQFTPEGQACLQELARDGVTIPDTDNGNHQAMTACDNVQFLLAALNAAPAGAPLTREAVAAGVRALGTRYRSTISFAVRFPAGHGDGAAEFRYGAFEDACSCFRYTSGLHDFS